MQFTSTLKREFAKDFEDFMVDVSKDIENRLPKTLEDARKDRQIHAILLDLRNNGGGLLPQAVAVSSLFMKSGFSTKISLIPRSTQDIVISNKVLIGVAITTLLIFLKLSAVK